VNVLGMGPLELIFILILALMVFGPDKLPEIARQIGKVVAEVRRITSDVSTEINRSISLEPDKTPEPAPRNAFVRPVPPPSNGAATVETQPAAPASGITQTEEIRPPY
jgi:Tat protein translocase TatB subunit